MGGTNCYNWTATTTGEADDVTPAIGQPQQTSSATKVLSEDVVLNLFDKVGGVPRSVWLIPSADPKDALATGLDRVENALALINDTITIIQSLQDRTETSELQLVNEEEA